MLRLSSAALGLLLLSVVQAALTASIHAAPPSQGPGEEPTKAPYVFPTPIFIPTYAGETVYPTSTPARASTPPAIKPLQGDRVYTVVQGDSPWIISKKVYGSGAKYQAILNANGLTEDSLLKIGSVLRIPGVDAAGNPLPVAVPTVPLRFEPTAASVAEIEPNEPVTSGTTVSVTAKTNSKNSAGERTMAELAINVLAFVLLIGSGVCGAFAFLYYRRSERVKKFETLAKRVHSTK